MLFSYSSYYDKGVIEFIFIVFLFILGLCVGSFVDVVADRIPREESLIHKGSYCESCKKRLVWKDLIPVLSYIVQKGKCRYCQSKLSLYYPSVEFITGTSFVVVFLALFSPQSPFLFTPEQLFQLLFALFVVTNLMIIFFTDLKSGIIPFLVLLPLAVVSFFVLLVTNADMLTHLLSASLAFGLFLGIFLLTRGRGMGFGDVVYVFFMGLLLGFPEIVVGLYIAFLTGATAAIILILLRRKKFKGDSLPFGPFLAFGTFVAFFWGNPIWQAALNFFYR